MSLSRFALASLAVVVLGATAAACSSPVPPTPQGAWNVNFLTGGSTCNIVAHNTQFGVVTDTMRTTIPVNGSSTPSGTAQITCSVIANSDGTFSVSADAQAGPDDLSLTISNLSPTASQKMPSTGSIDYASDHTSGNQFTTPSKTPCNFYVLNSMEGVAAGKVWVAFDCPSVTESGTSTPGSCVIAESYAIFENCSTMTGM